jgi:hypothetical protein
LPTQRRLLREIVIDLAMATETTKAPTTQTYMFFSPSPARIAMPEDMPAEVAARLAAYQTKKAMLKKELYDTIYKYDGKVTFLVNPLRSMADKQEKAVAELESLAEDIRVGLEPVSATIQPPVAGMLPSALIARAGEFTQQRAALQRETAARIGAIVARLRAARTPITISYRFENDGLHYVALPGGGRGGRGRGGGGRGGVTPQVAEELEKVQEQLGEIGQDYGRAFADLVNSRDSLRRDIAAAMNLTEAQAIDRALANAMRAAAVKEDENAYREYRIAVLMPGLSPDQRMLLFDAAVTGLALPLPRGELQPNRRAETW